MSRPTITVEVAFSTANPLTIPGSWTDISTYVQMDELSVRRGRQDELSGVSASELILVLDNRDRRFEPEFTSGAYYPNLVPRRRIRVRMTWNAVSYTVFQGFIKSWTPTYDPMRGMSVTRVSATDWIGAILARTNVAQTLLRIPWPDVNTNFTPSSQGWAQPGDRRIGVTFTGTLGTGSVQIVGLDGGGGAASEFVNLVAGTAFSTTYYRTITNLNLFVGSGTSGTVEIFIDSQIHSGNTGTGNSIDALLWIARVATGDRSINSGISSIAPRSIGGTVASAIQQVADTENGLFFINRSGQCAFEDRHSRLTAASTATLAPSGSLPYENIVIRYDDTYLYNEVEAARIGGASYTERDATSITAYGRNTLPIGALPYVSDAEAQSAAQWDVQRYKDPGIRVERLTLRGELAPATLWPVLLAAELNQRYTVQLLPPGATSGTLTQDVFLEGIQIAIRGEQWVWTFNLSPANGLTYWILQDAVLGVLDSTTRLAY